MNITDEQVHHWLRDQAAASKVPHLLLVISTEYPDSPFHAKIEGSSLYYGFGKTAANAIEGLKSQLPDAKAAAKKLRQQAALQLKEAELLETVTPAEVIADKEGAA